VPATLAAWTVNTGPGGTVTVTIRALRDPAGLQARLRMDGIPASVTFFGKPNPACHAPTVPVHDFARIFSFSAPARHRNEQVIVIHRSGLPPGAGVELAAAWAAGPGSLGAKTGNGASPGTAQPQIIYQFADAYASARRHHRPRLAVLAMGVVGTSPACTG